MIRKLFGIWMLVLLPLGAPAEPQRCDDYNAERNAYFGDTHVHTALSFDANALGVRNTPYDAYRFAQGERVGLQPYDPNDRPLRSVKLGRPLDFAIVTDHASLLGEIRLCQQPDSGAHESAVCRLYRRWPLLAYFVVNSRTFNVANPMRYSFCGENGQLCRDAAAAPWKMIQDAADAADDPSPMCRFTSFVGYEWSGGPESKMIHRNVIFRNRVVPDHPVGYIDEPTVKGLWSSLRKNCLDRDNGCDVLTIPHNSNLSGGLLFQHSPADAKERAFFEPLVEIMQHKGDSECSVETSPTEDELCGFEKLPFAQMDQQPFKFLWSQANSQSYVRDALGRGLIETQNGRANPFKFGIIASTDSHLGTPGLVDESAYPGHGAGGDTSRVEIAARPDAAEFNPGGLAVVWAEENSREAIFKAMRRRETYGTSGPRIRLRFFAGSGLAEDLCERSDFVSQGYAHGVPMGGTLKLEPGGAAPRFAVWAGQDPDGNLLRKIQIVKLSVRGDEILERVHDVATHPGQEASVDLNTCKTFGSGASSLCAVWRDPDYQAHEQSTYYVRVLENPSCRWTQHLCIRNPNACSDVPPIQQERAWSSPIWLGNPVH